MVLIRSRILSSPSGAIFSAVSAGANSAGVALLTPASVACAERTTATSSVNGLTYCSSVFGSGLACRNRRNASSTSAAVQALGFLGFGLPDLAFGTALFAVLGIVLRAMKPV